MKTAKNCYQTIFRLSLALAFLLAASSSSFSQNKWVYEDDGCGATRWGNKSPYGANDTGAFNLEIKEQTLSAARKLSVDAGENGGIRVKGWERNEIYIKACVQAFGKDEREARVRTAAVRIESEGGVVRAVSSSASVPDGNYSFGVSYDIRVPANTDLNLKTHNGGINLAGITGLIEFDLHNGGVILDRISGSVRGQTVNGNLTFNLSGERWEGEGGIDTSTTNGSVFINVPENYSARLETTTRRGNFYVNLPVEKKRGNNYELNLDLGAGGSIIRAATTNGQVIIKSKTVAAKENKL